MNTAPLFSVSGPPLITTPAFALNARWFTSTLPPIVSSPLVLVVPDPLIAPELQLNGAVMFTVSEPVSSPLLKVRLGSVTAVPVLKFTDPPLTVSVPLGA